MSNRWRRVPIAVSLLTVLGGCGLFTPEKGFLSNDDTQPPNPSPQGMFEQNVVAHIRCEIRNGVARAVQLPNVAWLKTYGATVTLKLTAEDQSGLTPNASFLTPFVNAAESFTLGIGGSGTAHATRVETIQFSYSNAELLAEAYKDLHAGLPSCQGFQHGIMIDSDLKIGQFIYDKAVIAGAAGEATSKSLTTAPFSQLQFELTFTASLGGNITPTWKFTRTTVNSGTLFSATRTNTDYVVITLGAPTADTKALHNAAVTGSFVGQSNQSLVR
jgi:hypothetical protein